MDTFQQALSKKATTPENTPTPEQNIEYGIECSKKIDKILGAITNSETGKYAYDNFKNDAQNKSNADVIDKIIQQSTSPNELHDNLKQMQQTLRKEQETYAGDIKDPSRENIIPSIVVEISKDLKNSFSTEISEQQDVQAYCQTEIRNWEKYLNSQSPRKKEPIAYPLDYAKDGKDFPTSKDPASKVSILDKQYYNLLTSEVLGQNLPIEEIEKKGLEVIRFLQSKMPNPEAIQGMETDVKEKLDPQIAGNQPFDATKTATMLNDLSTRHNINFNYEDSLIRAYNNSIKENSSLNQLTLPRR